MSTKNKAVTVIVAIFAVIGLCTVVAVIGMIILLLLGPGVGGGYY